MRWEGWLSRRTFQTIFIVVMGLAFLPTIFPVFAVANRVEPLVFGFPFPFSGWWRGYSSSSLCSW